MEDIILDDAYWDNYYKNNPDIEDHRDIIEELEEQEQDQYLDQDYMEELIQDEQLDIYIDPEKNYTEEDFLDILENYDLIYNTTIEDQQDLIEEQDQLLIDQEELLQYQEELLEMHKELQVSEDFMYLGEKIDQVYNLLYLQLIIGLVVAMLIVLYTVLKKFLY